MVENQHQGCGPQGRSTAAICTSTAFVLSSFDQLFFGILVIQSAGFMIKMIFNLVMEMSQGCLIGSVLIHSRLVGRINRTTQVTQHGRGRGQALQWNDKGQQIRQQILKHLHRCDSNHNSCFLELPRRSMEKAALLRMQTSHVSDRPLAKRWMTC